MADDPYVTLGVAKGASDEDIRRACRKLAKDVRGGVIERSGHWIAEEQPEQLVDHLLGFFGEE